jgi:integrase/recombinase XerD
MAKRNRKRLPKFLTEDEVEAIVAIPNMRYFTGERNRVLLNFYLNTGARLSEGIDVKWTDIDLNSGSIYIVDGKGGKDRVIWIGGEYLTELQHWRTRQGQQLGRCEFVFTTHKGGQLQPRYIEQMVNNYRDRAGLEKHITPHMLRHTFATRYLEKTKNIRKVQEALGHTDVSTTMVYTHVVPGDIMDMIGLWEKRK